MFYAFMRPSEVAALTKAGCQLPEEGWGHLSFADSSPAAGKAYTDDGAVHEHRGLKGRTKGRPSARRPVRKVPIPRSSSPCCATTSKIPFPQVRTYLALAIRSAPSRIRTCAHGSGGRCSLP